MGIDGSELLKLTDGDLSKKFLVKKVNSRTIILREIIKLKSGGKYPVMKEKKISQFVDLLYIEYNL